LRRLLRNEVLAGLIMVMGGVGGVLDLLLELFQSLLLLVDVRSSLRAVTVLVLRLLVDEVLVGLVDAHLPPLEAIGVLLKVVDGFEVRLISSVALRVLILSQHGGAHRVVIRLDSTKVV